MPLKEILARWRPWLPAAYVVAFLASLIAASAAWPIVLTDTDVWYHLAGGRFIAATGHFPSDSFFSFLSPPRPFLDYYWFFQVLVYRVHLWAGWGGLVALRTAFFAALAVTVALLAFSGKPGRPVWAAFLTVVALTGLMPRCMVLRPHLAEYFLIVFFLYVLEERPRWAWSLPPLAVVWGNIHGVSYPVLLWLCGSYVGERLLARTRWSPDRQRRALADLPFVCAGLAMAAVFVTPFGHRLLDVPFMPLDRARYQVGELHPVEWADFINWNIVGGALTSPTAFNVLFFFGLFAAVEAARRREARTAHLLLVLGGVLLLTRCRRFFYELALFSLPLLREHPPFEVPRPKGGLAALLASLLLMAGSFLPPAIHLLDRPAYPYSLRGLPCGVTAFLKREGGGGKLLQHPDLGGFYEWELYPQYRINMDMQMPFLFSQEDFYLAHEAFSYPVALRYFVDKYHPEFIAAPRASPRFVEAARSFPEYRPVFVDDNAVLYASRALRPELVRRWELPLDPWEVPELGPETGKAVGPFEGCAPRFIARMLDAAPDNPVPLVVAARYCISRGDTATAEARARKLIALLPNTGVGYRLLGESYERAGRDRDAAPAYERALRGTGPGAATVHQRLSKVYGRLGLPRLAARHAELSNPSIPASSDFPEKTSAEIAAPRTGKL